MQLLLRRARLAAALVAAAVLTLVVIVPATSAPSVTSSSTCPITTLPPASACVAPAPTAARPAMPHNDMPQNGLSAMALLVNEPFLTRLAGTALAPHLFSDASWHPALAQPYAADLMKYLASCALDPCDVIALPPAQALAHVAAAHPHGFPGELGLCGARYLASGAAPPGETRWADRLATDGCRERVTACVLARVNAVGKRVALSLRGDGLDLIARVPIEPMLRENHGTPILSFQGCDALCLDGDPLRRNCDWEPRYVGQCVRGDAGDPNDVRPVSLALPAGAPGRIRVCRGIHGCDDPAPGAGPTTVPTPPPYGGTLLVSGWNQVTFDCPGNGPIVGTLRTGYYGVMVAAAPGGSLPAATDVALVASLAADPIHDAYPAPEAQVFTYREGGFYGDLFGPQRSSRTDAMLANDQHVCWSDLWSAGLAMANDRFCAGPSSACFVNPPQRCDPDFITNAPGVATPHPWSMGAEVYDKASAPPHLWGEPYTTYLNHPCDLMPNLATCLSPVLSHLRPDVVSSL